MKGSRRLDQELYERIVAAATRLRIPGVAAGLDIGGRRVCVYYGVTGLENPLPVDSRTLFQVGSNTKLFTATAMMRLVEEGKIDLDAPVRKYLPELRVRDRDTQRRIRVRQLFNHTAGWSGDCFMDTGPGDDALARFIERMEEPEQEYPLGKWVSYNNASFSIAGRIIEKATGQVFEDAIRRLVIEPLRLTNAFFPPYDTAYRRVAVGHFVRDGTVDTARRWLLPRSCSAAGTLCATPADLLDFAHFHIQGRGSSRVLSARTRRNMRQRTAMQPGMAIGDAVGAAWLIHDLDGAEMVGHGGGTNGQISLFQTVPARDFAIAVLTNASTGGELNAEILDWALERCVGIKRRKPDVLAKDDPRQRDYAGAYRAANIRIELVAKDGKLNADFQLTDAGWSWATDFVGEQAPNVVPPPFAIEALEGDRFRLAGSKRPAGVFVREKGRVAGLHFNGRLVPRERQPGP